MTGEIADGRHLVITGVVQGVGFRYHMTIEARRLGVSGWVRNRRDGSVEAEIAGGPEAIAAMIAWARVGPASANVKQVVVEHIEVLGQDEGFEQRPTV